MTSCIQSEQMSTLKGELFFKVHENILNEVMLTLLKGRLQNVYVEES